MMQDASGNDVGVLALFRDITDELRLQLQTGNLDRFSNIIGRDAKMLQVFQQISDVAAYDYPVHIFGETGTGKEVVANAIHNESHRAGTPFVPINCGALPEGLIESFELFGHVKGIYRSDPRQKGRFELADRGTIFLDEVMAELSKPMQVKLLRFLQEGTFERVGGEKTIAVNVQVISATSKDLKEKVRHGSFREDLFYRLSVIPVYIPTLRERRTDIPVLVNHFMRETRAQAQPGVTSDVERGPVPADGLRLARQCPGTPECHPVCPGEIQRPNDHHRRFAHGDSRDAPRNPAARAFPQVESGHGAARAGADGRQQIQSRPPVGCGTRHPVSFFE